MVEINLIVGDVREKLRDLKDHSIDCVVTSPPYWGLRDYGVDGQIGLEPTLGEHLDVLVGVFREVWRILKPRGTLWLNYGDCYAAAPNGKSAAEYKADGSDDRTFRDKPFSTVGPIYQEGAKAPRIDPKRRMGFFDPSYANGRGVFTGSQWNEGGAGTLRVDTGGRVVAGGYLKPKDLCMLPNRLAIALQEDGWWVRSEIIWHKPNPMPESVYDRPTSSHEKVWLLTKGEEYFYNHEAIREPVSANTHARVAQANYENQVGSLRANGGTRADRPMKAVVAKSPGPNSRQNKDRVPNSRKPVPAGWDTAPGAHGKINRNRKLAEPGSGVKSNSSMDAALRDVVETRNSRNVWTIAPKAFKEAHFACVDDATEALTPTGWKRHHELTDGTLIAAYDRETGALRWQVASFHRYPFDGDLVAIEKRDMSQRLTENHRCLVKRRSGRVAVVEAAKLRPGTQMPTNAILDGVGTIGVGSNISALLGWYLAEGEKMRHRCIRINQSLAANPGKVETIRQLLFACGATFSEAVRKREWRGRPADMVVFSIKGEVAQRLHDLAPDKKISLAWVNWPVNEIRGLLDALIDGDGHRRTDGRQCFIQKDRASVDAVQILALRLGKRAIVSERSDGGHVVYLTYGNWLTLRSTDGKHKPIGRERYVGTVWCPSVPSTFWIARRRGRTFITGNTFPPELARRCILAGVPSTTCAACGADEGCGPICEAIGRKPGHVLDPFGGAGTVGLVAQELGLDCTLIELNPEYAAITRRRLGLETAATPRPEGASVLQPIEGGV